MKRVWILSLLLITMLTSMRLTCGAKVDDAAEALTSVSQALTSGEGEALATNVLQVSTDFTIGEAIETAAQELYAWFLSQMPCSTVTVSQNVLEVDFGELADDCTYNGLTYAGKDTITIVKNQSSGVEVRHELNGLTNGIIIVNGSLEVTWTAAESLIRHVVHDLTWTKSGRTLEASGDRTIEISADSFKSNGERDWVNNGNPWHLSIENIVWYYADPVPESGIYAVTTPNDNVFAISFARIDSDTIRATVSSDSLTWSFEVNQSTGEVTE